VLVARNAATFRELVEDDKRRPLPSVGVQNIEDRAVNAGDISFREPRLIGEDVTPLHPGRKILAGKLTRFFRIGEKRWWNAGLAKDGLRAGGGRDEDSGQGKTS
jgi:hypothetical protein